MPLTYSKGKTCDYTLDENKWEFASMEIIMNMQYIQAQYLQYCTFLVLLLSSLSNETGDP